MADEDGTKRDLRERGMIEIKLRTDHGPDVTVVSHLLQVQGTELRVDHIKVDFRLKISTVKIERTNIHDFY